MEKHKLEADASRLESRIQALAAISEPCEAGILRQCYTKEYRKGVDLVKGWMKDAGLLTWEDPVGNLFGRLPGEEGLEEIFSGSHLDTVRCAGAYDGITGVLCALEAAEMIVRSGRPLRHPYTVFGTVGEEGTRFGQIDLGSQFMTGIFGEKDLDDIRGLEDGKTLRQVLKEYGAVGPVADACLVGKPIRAFLELHGEQGPVLDDSGCQAGIVEAIFGSSWMEVEVTGVAGHSGTVPMDRRKDAGIGAYGMILEMDRYIKENYMGKATMTAGQLRLYPGSPNCIPGRCVFTLDVRSGDPVLLRSLREQVRKLGHKTEEKGYRVEVRELSFHDPAAMDGELKRLLTQSCEELGISCRPLYSGAGHDSTVFSEKWPTAMLFLPNRDGISHHPAEWIAPEDMKRGAEILYQTIRHLDEE